MKQFIALIVWITLGAAGAVLAQETPPPLPGHSLHGETFNEGPRQKAYLMGTAGKINFPVTTSNPEVQAFINQGIGQLHGFWYFEAERSFRQAAALDPECAIAYWGMAYANVNNEKRAKGFMAEAVKRRDKVSERERMYINAWNSYIEAGPGKNKDRYPALVHELEQILFKYPDDLDAKAFLALRLWDNRSGGIPVASHLAIDALLSEVFQANPMHPAHHYRIHLWDGVRQEKAIDAASKCGASAPGIAHMWHMSGHTYSGLKWYREAVWQQEASARVDHAHMMRDWVLPDQIHNFAHNNEWCIRNMSHIGKVRDAIILSKNMIELPRHPKYNTIHHGSSHFGRSRLWEVLDRFELWDESLALMDSSYLNATGDEGEDLKRRRQLARAYFRSGRLREGQSILAEMEFTQGQLSAERDLKGEEAAANARKENKNDQQINEARENAKRPYAGRIDPLGSAISECRGYLAIELGDLKTALDLLRKSGGVPAAYLARLEWRNGNEAEAIRILNDSVNSHQFETAPLAQAIQLFWEMGKQDLAKEKFDQLRELSTDCDLTAPIFRRLEPIAVTLGYGSDWRIIKPLRAEFGQRETLDSLGPFRWQPVQAPDWALRDQTGMERNSDSYRGRPVIAVFYLGYGCLHCAEQLQKFVPKQKEFADAGFDLIAISTDSIDDLKKSIENYKAGPMPIPLLADNEFTVFKKFRVFDDFESRPLHATFVIDAQGKIRWQDVGFEPFMDPDFVLGEAKRLLSLPIADPGSVPTAATLLPNNSATASGGR